MVGALAHYTDVGLKAIWFGTGVIPAPGVADLVACDGGLRFRRGVGGFEPGLAALGGELARRQVGRKNDCLRGSKLSPQLTKPNSIERRTL